jgi:hypothetical protein
MDDEGYPSRWWARLFFEQRLLQSHEWLLGLVVLGLLLGGAWLIFWPYLPGLLSNILIGMFDLFSWIGGLFSGSGSGTPAATPVGTAITPPAGVLPSPSPSPSPSPIPIPR